MGLGENADITAVETHPDKKGNILSFPSAIAGTCGLLSHEGAASRMTAHIT